MPTLTVRLAESALTQTELQEKLYGLVRCLKVFAPSDIARVEPVFPGDEHARRKGVFVVEVTREGELIAHLLEDLPGVLQAYVAPSRG